MMEREKSKNVKGLIAQNWIRILTICVTDCVTCNGLKKKLMSRAMAEMSRAVDEKRKKVGPSPKTRLFRGEKKYFPPIMRNLTSIPVKISYSNK